MNILYLLTKADILSHWAVSEGILKMIGVDTGGVRYHHYIIS